MTLSALDGVPASWKDLFDSAGIETESGTRLLKDRIPAKDAETLRRASAAGMVCLGKTHQTEFAFSGLGVNEMTATPPNAAMPGHAPGGSSSGAAAAIALDLAPIAMGSDTGGSIRIPACWNNLVGLKPGFGVLPGDGIVPLCPGFDTPGPLTRTVEDATLVFDILAGLPHQITEVPDAASLSFLVPTSHVFDGCDEAVLTAFENALQSLDRAGVKIHRKPMELLTRVQPLSASLFPYEAWRQWGELISERGDEMYLPVRKRFELGRKYSREQYLEAQLELDKCRAEWRVLAAQYDGVLWPTVPILPPRVSELLADEDHFTSSNLMALRNTRLINMLGGCALTLPLPEIACGLQIACDGGEDRKLLAIGKRVESCL